MTSIPKDLNILYLSTLFDQKSAPISSDLEKFCQVCLRNVYTSQTIENYLTKVFVIKDCYTHSSTNSLAPLSFYHLKNIYFSVIGMRLRGRP